MADFEVWARSVSEREPSLRMAGDRLACEDEALRLGRGSGDEGAMSVVVVAPGGEVVWAAGEAARGDS